MVRDPLTGGTQIETGGPLPGMLPWRKKRGFTPWMPLEEKVIIVHVLYMKELSAKVQGLTQVYILYKVEQGFKSFGFQNLSHSLIIVILPKIKIIISHTVLKSAFAFNKYIMNIFPYI